ncbi:DNA-processing protein DprA [Candidatus Parcubacteria bacterium]|nr:DNA-processing protein DprA [Patescibacteria group bacterium]MBU4466645.1 DNA-processing protein DprA [Patescibacteria group bacterium]MCG2688613.1 DNA-processing protein DprA [Candidatus Parcubacteria bacterium]
MENVVELKDKKYPELLKKIKGAPKKLYYKGNWEDIFSAEGGPASGGKNCLAVVGSRRLTSYGRRMTQLLVSEIAASGITIVSGFMYGGDEAAHQATVEVGGRTIAVMPCGIDLIHPEYQEELYQKILDNRGLILSEFEGNFPPALWTYPKRDRIVAGLSQAVLVVEAGLVSGTFITVKHARSFGRKVFAVPGPLTSEVSKGTAQMIKEGAEIVTEAKDVLKYFKLDSCLAGPSNSIGAMIKMSDQEKKIMENLKREPLEADGLARALSLPVSKISADLSLMQIKGFIKQEGNKYYVQ